LVSTALIIPMAQPAAARVPKYAGAAPGSVSCSLSAKVPFSPALTDAGGGTNPSTVKGWLSGCTSSNSEVTITAGKVTGSFASSPLSCVTKTTTGAAASLSVAWKGSVNGFLDGTTYAGKASFTPSTVTGNSDIGSFFGPAEVSVDAPSNLATLCEAKRGIRTLTLAGTVIIGTQVIQTIPVGFGPHGVSSDGTHVWVVNGAPSSNSVTELDASTGAVVQTIGVGSGAAAISSDGTHVWVVNEGANSVTEIDASTGAVVQTIGVGNFPDAVSSDGTHVWVTNSGDNTVTELNASTGAVVQTIGVGTSPSGVSSDGTDVWVTNDDDNTVTELDASTGAIVQTIGVGVAPDAVSSDGTHVWVTNFGNEVARYGIPGSITELDASTGAVVQTIGVDGFPPNSISSDGTHVWVTSYNYIGGWVGELDASTGETSWGNYVENAPDAVSSDGTHAWVTNGGDNTVTEIEEQ
jgi:YVTN family beta-propeller protein